jgi:uncharacterized damage-inducible protein DinB
VSMIEHIQRLFTYDDWANREVLAALTAVPYPPPLSLKFLAHVLSAKRLWLERLREQKQTHPIWPNFRLGQCQSEAAELAELWKNYLDSLGEAELSGSITYKNTKGESFTSQREDILTHVIMHSAYHRGQIATDMRSAGLTPAYTDFIHAVRSGLWK